MLMSFMQLEEKSICKLDFEWGEMIENIIQDDYIRITFSRDNDADNLDLRKLRIEEIKK